MTNFAERIAYWYLRFNGFFLLENFVHHHRPGERRASDLDLLGVRLKHTREIIDEQTVTFDDWSQLDVNLSTDNVAVIVQVKGGGGDPSTAFVHDRIVDAIHRIGSFDELTSIKASSALMQHRDVVVDDWKILKLVIGPTPIRNAHYIPLEAAWDFVRERVQTFGNRKRGDWTHFPDILIQLLAWEIERE